MVTTKQKTVGVTLEIDGEDTDCVVSGSPIPGFRGDRNEPGYGADVEDVTVRTDPGGVDVTARLDEKALARAADELLQSIIDDPDDEPGQEWDDDR